MNIIEFRKQNPQYNSLSDGDLAYRLWNTHYKDKLPMGVFADRMKLPQQSFVEMTDIARSSGYTPTSESGTPSPVGRATGAPRAALQGATFGFGDEIVGNIAGGVQAASNLIQGRPANFGGEAQRFTEQERGRLSQFRQEAPVTAIGSEIAGAVGSAVVTPPVRALQALAPVTRAAVTGGASGAAYGLGTGEGGLENRLQNAVEVGIPSALFGGALQGAVQVGGRYAPRLAESFQKSIERPSIETLRDAKTAAYKAVDDSGLTFDQNQIQGLFQRATQLADDFDFVNDPAVFPETYSALRILERRAGANNTTIGQLDGLRQTLWQRFNRSNGSEPAVRAMIDEIDDLVENYPATSELMDLARLANSRFKKAELLDNAMSKAQLQTASTGSGGNILNKYKQAVTSILTNKKTSKYFTADEIAQMEQFVQGGFGSDLMRQIGKLSPTGNGLMTALNIGAIAANPAMAAVTVAGAGAKVLSDRSGERAMQGLLNTMSGVPLRPAARVPFIQGMPAAAASAEAQRQQ